MLYCLFPCAISSLYTSFLPVADRVVALCHCRFLHDKTMIPRNAGVAIKRYKKRTKSEKGTKKSAGSI